MQIKDIWLHKENIDGSLIVFVMDNGKFFVPDIQDNLTVKLKETTLIEPDTTIKKSWWARMKHTFIYIDD